VGKPKSVKKFLPEFLAARLDAEKRYGLRLTLFALAIVLATLPFGLLLKAVVDRNPRLQSFDTALSEHLYGWTRGQEILVLILKVLSFLGKPLWFYILIGGVSIYLFRLKRIRLMTFLIATTAGGGIVDTIIKVAVNRGRPEVEIPLIHAVGKSFPSGHAMTSTIAYGALLLIFMPLVPRRWRPTALGATVLLVLAIGFSRLALGVHFVTDVIGGYVLGLSWLIAATAAFSIWRQERGRKPVEVKEGVEPEAARDLKP